MTDSSMYSAKKLPCLLEYPYEKNGDYFSQKYQMFVETLFGCLIS